MMFTSRHLLFAYVLCVICSFVVLATEIDLSKKGDVLKLLEDAQAAANLSANLSAKAQEAAANASMVYGNASEALIKAADTQMLALRSVDEEIEMLRVSVMLLEIKNGNETGEWKSEQLPLVADAGLFRLQALMNESIYELNTTAVLARNAQVTAKAAVELQKAAEAAMLLEAQALRNFLLDNNTEELIKVMEAAENATVHAEMAGRAAEHFSWKTSLQAQKAFEKVAEAMEAQKKHEETAAKHALYTVTLEEHENTVEPMRNVGSAKSKVEDLVKLANKTGEQQWEAFADAAQYAAWTHANLTHALYLLEQKETLQAVENRVPGVVNTQEQSVREMIMLNGSDVNWEMQKMSWETQIISNIIMELPVYTNILVEVIQQQANEIEFPIMHEQRMEPLNITPNDLYAAKLNILPNDPVKREKVAKAMELLYDIDGTAAPSYITATLLPFIVACAAAVVLLA